MEPQMIATLFMGIGSMLIFGMVTPMLTEYMPHRSASLIALNSLGRNLFNCIGGTIALPLIAVIGIGWLFTGLGVIIMANFLLIYAMRKYGKGWREKQEIELNGSE